MTKHKQPPQNFLRYLLDKYILFQRDFHIATPANVEDCVKSMLALSQEEREDEFNARRISPYVTTAMESSGVVYFIVIAEQQIRSSYVQSANAEGCIESDEERTTRITGKVLMSVLAFWGMIGLCGFLLLIFVVANSIIGAATSQWSTISILVLFGTFMIYSWIRMYRDRNYLVQQIQHAIENAGREAHLSKAKNESSSQLLDNTSEYQSHHAQK
jgi:hypothetical protein